MDDERGRIYVERNGVRIDDDGVTYVLDGVHIYSAV
jgi:hypothetical protein